MGREIGEVLLAQFAQGIDQGFWGAHGPGGEGIGFKFVNAGPVVREGRQPKGDRAAEQSK